ncbi:MAG: GNAT family N-acetyltransferase [Lachnospiraceae bacterium]|nr:GNAT family N-acetyltransferase [Lachnospiraceae bacterium]
MDIRYLSSEDDLFEISSIYEKSWKYAYKDIVPQDFLDSIPAGRWADRIGEKGINNLVVMENGLLVGTASFCRSRWKEYSDYGEVISIYFLPEYIGKGYGKHLLSKCVEELKKLGFSDILLWVLEDNHRARNFYEKNGFAYSEECRIDTIGGKELRELLYVCKQ